MPPKPQVNSERLWRGIEDLAKLTDGEKPFTRRAFSDLYLEGRRYLAERFDEAGLSVTRDTAGNLVGRRAGTEQGLGSVAVGSHSDTVPAGGRFDGIVGVLAGLEIAETLSDAGMKLRHPFEVIDFLAEEPSPYGLSCIGSRAVSGGLSADLLAQQGPDGSTLKDGIARVGGDPDRLGDSLRSAQDIACFLEVHIEQGPVLESTGVPIGVVTDIAGITRVEIVVRGRAAHSGTTPMTMRSDALVAASEIVLWVARQATEWAETKPGFVATIGRQIVEPNGANVVAGRVTMTLEIRSGSDKARSDFLAETEAYARGLAGKAGLEIDMCPISESGAAACDNTVIETLSEACRSAGVNFRMMSSGAGHDTAHMARVVPSGMIFIPCRDGRSHCPEEWADRDHVACGAQVLCDAVILHDATAETNTRSASAMLA